MSEFNLRELKEKVSEISELMSRMIRLAAAYQEGSVLVVGHTISIPSKNKIEMKKEYGDVKKRAENLIKQLPDLDIKKEVIAKSVIKKSKKTIKEG